MIGGYGRKDYKDMEGRIEGYERKDIRIRKEGYKDIVMANNAHVGGVKFCIINMYRVFYFIRANQTGHAYLLYDISTCQLTNLDHLYKHTYDINLLM